VGFLAPLELALQENSQGYASSEEDEAAKAHQQSVMHCPSHVLQPNDAGIDVFGFGHGMS
jgi:hypothetical protein